MACCAACSRGSSGQASACAGGACSVGAAPVAAIDPSQAPWKWNGQTPARNWFEGGLASPFVQKKHAPSAGLRTTEHAHDHAPTGRLGHRAPASAMQKRGRLTNDFMGDVYLEEPSSYENALAYRATGDLWSGTSGTAPTQAEWDALGPEGQRRLVANTPPADRAALISRTVAEGITGVSAIVLEIFRAEQARITSEAARTAAAAQQANAIELAQIQANRDIAIANAQHLNTTPPATTPMTTTTKVLIGGGITVGVLGVGFLAWKALK